MASSENLILPRRRTPASYFPGGFTPRWMAGNGLSVLADTPQRYFDYYQAGYREQAAPAPRPVPALEAAPVAEVVAITAPAVASAAVEQPVAKRKRKGV